MAIEKRTPIGKFIHTSWINMNLRCGKYRHLGNKNKNKVYLNISIIFSREEFKKWCLENEKYILSFNRPSIDRIDSNKNYSLDNIQILELIENIRKKKMGNSYINGSKSKLKRGIRKTPSNKWEVRITINSKEKHLGTFKTQEEAEIIFINTYFNYYGRNPW